MSRELGKLSREEEDAILEMRDQTVLIHDAEHMARMMVTALRGPDAYEASDSIEWLGHQLVTTLGRLAEHIANADQSGKAAGASNRAIEQGRQAFDAMRADHAQTQGAA